MIRDAVILAALATPAAGLTPPWLVCDNADGTRSEFIDTYGDDEPAFAGLTFFEIHGDDTPDTITKVIAHCSSGKGVSYPRTVDYADRDPVWDILESGPQMTVGQLARKMKRMGIDAKYGRIEAGNCACNPATHRNSF